MEVDFATLKVNKSLVKDWKVILKGRYDNIRLYLKPDDERSGFIAVVVEFASSGIHGKDISHWDLDDLSVEFLHEIYASADGIRHHHVMKGSDGYLHYPDLDFHVALFKKLIEFELEFCHMADRHDADFVKDSVECLSS